MQTFQSDVQNPQSADNKIEALRNNYIAYFQLFAGQHGIAVHEDPETAWIVANGPPGNHILRTSFPQDDVENKIQGLLHTLSRRTGGVRWLVFPGDQPGDLAERLTAQGLSSDRGDFWMFRTLDDDLLQATDTDCICMPVTDLPGLRSWWTVSAQGFGMTQRAAQIWYDAYRRHGFGPDAYASQHVCWVGRRPVASATLVLAGGMAGIYDVSTVPAYRNQGFATSLTRHLLIQARQQGYQQAGLQTSDAVALYERLGFLIGFQEVEFFWAAAN